MAKNIRVDCVEECDHQTFERIVRKKMRRNTDPGFTGTYRNPNRALTTNDRRRIAKRTNPPI